MVTEILNRYKGKHYPQNNELKGMIHLLDVIIDQFKFLHPKDVSDESIKRFQQCQAAINFHKADFEKKNGLPEYLNQDITFPLYEILQQKYVDKILECDKFEKDE